MRKLISLMTIFLTTSTAPISVVACSNNKTMNLNKVLTNVDLGDIDTSGMSTPTTIELDEAIRNKNHNININAIRLGKPNNDSVEVSGDGTTYVGTTTVKFTLQQHIPITNIIINGEHIKTIVQTEGKEIPNKNDIITALKSEYPDTLNTDKIVINNKDITNNQVTISGDGTTYTGTTIISFDMNRMIELDKVITNPKIGTILTKGKDIPSSDDIKAVLKTKYDTLCTDKIKIEKINSTGAKVESNDFSVYTPTPIITLSFNVDKHIDFNKTLKDTKLGQIHIDSKVQAPTADQIIVALKANNLNPDLNVQYIKVEDIKPDSAKITSTDQSVYRGPSIIVNYEVNKSTDLSKIISNPDLGTFKFTPDKTKPTVKDITDKLVQYSLQLNKINITNISATSAIISSTDQSVYTGSVTLKYKVDNSVTLDSVLTTKDLGTINTNGLQEPNKDTVVKAIVNNNTKVTTNYIAVDKITNNSALVTGDNIHYTGSLTVTFKVDNSTINNTISYKDSQDYSATSGGTSNSFAGKDQVILANWTNYAKNWNDFITTFPKLSFGKDANFEVWMNTCDDKKLSGDQLSYDTNKITTDKTNKAFSLGFHYSYSFLWSADLNAYITIWHDDANVYVNWHGSMSVGKLCPRDSQFAISLPEADFHQ